MAQTLFFYDLETSGIYPDTDRIIQFAGQRTDTRLKPIGDPYNLLIRLHEDVLPDPSSVLIHGITPQQTIEEGLSETEFLKIFYTHIVQPQTTFVGFNNVRFDDEFMRYLNYRNLYDPYAWSYENDSSRWDMLDVVRITRALRPEGISWPVDQKTGANVNRLELLASANKLQHHSAHDALSDTQATIDLARLVKKTQPKLFEYLFKLRLKSAAAELVDSGLPFVYTSSHYPSSQLHTTIVVKVADHPQDNCVLVYDLRKNPDSWLRKTAQELADSWRYIKDRPKDDLPLPVKTLRLNRCPAIAPISVAQDSATLNRLGIKMDEINKNLEHINKSKAFFSKQLVTAVGLLNDEQQIRRRSHPLPLDARLYSGLLSAHDKRLLQILHNDEDPDGIRKIRPKFEDDRLRQLCSFYLARNYKNNLSNDERIKWESYVQRKLFAGGPNSRLATYFQRISQLSQERADSHSQILLEDLKLYGESLIPSDVGN